MDTRYANVVGFVRRSPWAILPEKLAEIRALIAERAAGVDIDPAELEARFGAAPKRTRPYAVAGNVAVLPIAGTIVPKADLLSAMSGATSAESLKIAFTEAMADDDVASVLFDVDSPGGATDLVPEMAKTVRDARGRKPIVAVANTRAASAAYWIASQADEVVVTPSGDVGSIGVFSAHQDLSGYFEKAGITTTLISAGDFKTEGNPFEPLSEEAAAAQQQVVDEFYGMFVTDVAKGRRVSVGSVREEFGRGRMVTAKDAVRRGMADRVDTFDATLSRLARGRVSAAPAEPEDDTLELGDIIDGAEAVAVPFTVEAGALRDAADRLVVRLASLAEVRERRLTVAKREQLSACPEALRAAASSIDDVLAATDKTAPEPAPEAASSIDDAGLDLELAFVALSLTGKD